jgi:hypothetical protein
MKLVFYGLDAYVRSHAGKRIYFSTENPNHDPNMFVPLDLGKTPEAAEQGQIAWGDVIVDDVGDQNDKRTSVAPWKPGGRRKGGVYVEEKHLALLRRLFPLPVPHPASPAAKPHELMSVRYYAEDANGDSRRVGHRYLGYHAKILDPAKRTVQVWHAGTSGDPAAKPPIVIEDLDFDDPSKVDFHSSNHGYTEIGTADGQPKEGALFLKDDYARTVALEGAKKPPADGL